VSKYLWIAALLLLGTPLFAQDAKVVELIPSDAREAKAAYDEMKAAEKKWQDLNAKLQRTYKGFDGGIEFSSDFKFIVPKYGNSGMVTLTPSWNSCCCTLTPATGIFSGTTNLNAIQ
jgi:hypothetical protein